MDDVFRRWLLTAVSSGVAAISFWFARTAITRLLVARGHTETDIPGGYPYEFGTLF